ncbi:MAG: hypothetical protein V3V02_00990 [Rhizobiaceae bacterium]
MPLTDWVPFTKPHKRGLAEVVFQPRTWSFRALEESISTKDKNPEAEPNEMNDGVHPRPRFIRWTQYAGWAARGDKFFDNN